MSRSKITKFSLICLIHLMTFACSSQQGVPDTDTDTGGIVDDSNSSSASGTDSVSDGDADSDGDGDSDTDGDTDSDGDMDTDADSDADTDTDTDTDTNADTDSNSDVDNGTDADTGSDSFSVIGDCTSDDDCLGGTCVAVTPGGWHTCSSPIEETTVASSYPDMDECTTAMDCGPGAGCYLSTFDLGGLMAYNTCIGDECSTDDECGNNHLCIPGGVWHLPRSKCILADCKTSEDCQGGVYDGACAPTIDGCLGQPDGLAGFYCHYEYDGCISDADCEGAMTCQMSIGGDIEDFSCGQLFCPGK